MDNKGIKEISYIKNIIILIGVVGVFSFIIIGERRDKLAEKRYHEIAIEGMVDEINFFRSYHGTPSFKIKGAWYNFDLHGHKVLPFVKPGDSLVKKQGFDAIQIYRKNSDGEWELIMER